MTKSEIVKEISARTGIDGKAVLAVLEGFMNEVKTSLGKEENVYLRGFGSFIVKKRAQKTPASCPKPSCQIISPVAPSNIATAGVRFTISLSPSFSCTYLIAISEK